jgi:hypothetical protein
MTTRKTAFQSEDFIHSVEARPVRMLAEYAEPLARFHRHGVIDTIVFMGSARFLSKEAAEAELLRYAIVPTKPRQLKRRARARIAEALLPRGLR